MAVKADSEIRMDDEKPICSRFLEINGFLMKMGRGRFQIDRTWHCGHFGLCFFVSGNPFVFSKLAGIFDFLICRFVFVKMDVKSYPFGELVVNLACWTP